MQFEPVIGLEIHAQLATTTKMFCRCSTEFGAPPNQNTCPTCLGLPGALPVTNQRAVDFAVSLGLATHCEIRLDSQFARKNYFYPDLPKAYQISQFDRPICEHGFLNIQMDKTAKKIGITRIHLEEDAGKLVHEGQDPQASYVDLNRAGIPLVEIVSEPDLRTAEEAKVYMEKIYALVTALGICKGNMEQGNLRCDANISLRPVGTTTLGTRTETKNLNSFRFVQQAIEYEIARQTDALLEGKKIMQETRLYNSVNRQTYLMRSKEEANDYRYFPCPDLPIIQLSEQSVATIKNRIPELPEQKAARFVQAYQLSTYDAELLAKQMNIADYFEQLIAANIPPKQAANWIMGDLMRLWNENKLDATNFAQNPLSPPRLAALLELVNQEQISNKIAKQVLPLLYASQSSALEIVEQKGWKQVSDTSELKNLCQQIITANQPQVAQYKAGKTKIFGFFVGQVMQKTQGQANPKVINEIMQTLLNES